MTPQKERLLRAKIAIALLDTLKRRPTEVEIEKYTVAAQVLWKVVAGSKAEHDRLRKEFGSLDDQFLLEEFNPEIEMVGWSLDIVVTVKRTDDGKRFEIPLSELEAVEEDSDNAVLLNDFTVWKVNW